MEGRNGQIEFAIRFCRQQLARQGRQDPFICKGLGLSLGLGLGVYM